MLHDWPISIKKKPKACVFLFSLTSSDLSNGTYQLVALGSNSNCNSAMGNCNAIQFPTSECLFQEFLFVAKAAIVVRKI